MKLETVPAGSFSGHMKREKLLRFLKLELLVVDVTPRADVGPSSPYI